MYQVIKPLAVILYEPSFFELFFPMEQEAHDFVAPTPSYEFSTRDVQN